LEVKEEPVGQAEAIARYFQKTYVTGSATGKAAQNPPTGGLNAEESTILIIFLDYLGG
jgi:hypothetical protein